MPNGIFRDDRCSEGSKHSIQETLRLKVEVCSMTRIILVFAGIWLVFAAAGYGIGLLVFSQSQLERFVEKGVLIDGTVVKKDPGNHELITYEYSVNGRSYTGYGHGLAGNPRFKQIEIGQSVIVYYDRDIPANSMMGHPQGDLSVNRQIAWIIALLFPVFPMAMLISIYVGYRASKRPSAKEAY